MAFQRGSVLNALGNSSNSAAASEPEPEFMGVVDGALDGALQRGSVAQSRRSTALPRPSALPPPSGHSTALPGPSALPPPSAQVARVSLCEVSMPPSLSTASSRKRQVHWGADLPEEAPQGMMTQKKLAARRSKMAARRSHLDDVEGSMCEAPPPSSRRFGGGAATKRSVRQGSVEAPLTSRRLGGRAITRRGSVEAPHTSRANCDGETLADAVRRRLSARYGGSAPSSAQSAGEGGDPLACAEASSDARSRTRLKI